MVLGAGALLAPLAATQFAQLPRWSFYYFCSLGIAVSNTLFLWAVFNLKTQDGKFLCTVTENHDLSTYPECLVQIGQEAGEKSNSDSSTFRQILSLKAVHVLAFFILVYVGVEVTIGGMARYSYRVALKSRRVDRYFHHPDKRRWSFIWLYLCR